MFVVSGAFATGVSSTATTADCDKPTLNTYSGTSNLQAGWEPNPIALHWYDGDTELTVAEESQTCTYDGTLTPPSTIPTKTGYTFKGWRVKQAAGCSFTASEVNGMSGVAYSATPLNDPVEVTNLGEWTVEFNTGIIKGMVKCSSTNGSFATPGTPSYTGTYGKYCWCRATNYTPNGGNQCNVSSSSWVFVNAQRNGLDCASVCADTCARNVSDNADFRRAVFGVQ